MLGRVVAVGGCLVLAACSLSDVTEPSGPAREGPKPAWTLRVQTGDYGATVQVGDVMLVPDKLALIGVAPADGKELWRRELAADYRFWTAGAQVAVQANKDAPLQVLDAATGADRWSAPKATWDFVVYQGAVYVGNCTNTTTALPTGCTITARDIRDGRQLWTVPNATGNVGDEAIGARAPAAPAAGPYLAAGVGQGAKIWAAIDTATGRPLPGRAQFKGWYQFAAGSTLVSTDHDPPSGDSECTITVQTADGRTGKAWQGTVFGGRRQDNECVRRLVHDKTGLTLIGAGTRIAASTSGGRPQVFDLATGRTVWAGEKSGVPIDGDGKSVLVRELADEGALSLLDFETGKVRWTAEDPGLSGQSASWDSTVTGGLVAVSGATGDSPFVRVYDVNTGRQLGQFPGWLDGAGDDWVAITHSGKGTALDLDLMRF